MQDQADPIEPAIERLWQRRTIQHAGRNISIACLIRTKDWRPLRADWWSGKDVCIIGADLDGNFFLRHCDGTVRYWEHRIKTDTVVANSVKDFVAAIVE